MKKNLFAATLAVAVMQAAAQNPAASQKIDKGFNNPISDAVYIADPTAIEHEGRLYVYGTNDHQQWDSCGVEGKNDYGKIHSLRILSTDDMVNWTHHGYIDVSKAAPWRNKNDVSWAPTVDSRKEADGKTHFYMYYSAGCAVGFLTATNPLGPWKDTLGHLVVNWYEPQLGKISCSFDPGFCIDDKGTGWLAVGGGDPVNPGTTDYHPGNLRLIKLKDDMTTYDKVTRIDAPYDFEANEMNFINGKYLLTYCTSWKERSQWNDEDYAAPTGCAMAYLNTATPLDSASWRYRGNILRNPGDFGLGYSNNHTHMHKYKGKWYMFYHLLTLANYRGIKGGYRSVAVDEIEVDEERGTIRAGRMTEQGVEQLKPLDPYTRQQAETLAASTGITFENGDALGNQYVRGKGEGQKIIVKGVDFGARGAKTFTVRAQGKGCIDVIVDGEVAATAKLGQKAMGDTAAKLKRVLTGRHDVTFAFRNADFLFDEWQFSE